MNKLLDNGFVAVVTAVKAGDLHHAEVLGEITIDQIDNVLAEN